MARFTPAHAAVSLAATSIATLMISTALAQTPPAAPGAKPAPQRPAAAPAKPAQPAPQQPGQPGQQADALPPELIYSQWLKFCVNPADGTPADQKDPAIKTKQVCYTGTDVRLESGQPLVAMVAIDPPGENPKLMRITLPVGMHLQLGTRLVIDQGQPLTAPYSSCFANGCFADYPLDADTLGKFRKAKSVVVQGISFDNSAISVPVPLTEFAKIYDGAPVDPKVLEQRQKKLEDELKKKGEELQKKADDARKKLEQGGAPRQ